MAQSLLAEGRPAMGLGRRYSGHPLGFTGSDIRSNCSPERVLGLFGGPWNSALAPFWCSCTWKTGAWRLMTEPSEAGSPCHGCSVPRHGQEAVGSQRARSGVLPVPMANLVEQRSKSRGRTALVRSGSDTRLSAAGLLSPKGWERLRAPPPCTNGDQSKDAQASEWRWATATRVDPRTRRGVIC